jgi:hypothetical protein
MPSIRTSLDPALEIDKPIEKVITFANRAPDVLEREARDYIVTDNLATDYRKLLDYFDDAQTGDRSNECCVWISGFYGSGKSSFAKYFGLNFDPSAQLGTAHFSEKFLTQFSDQSLRTRFNTVRSRYQLVVFLIDLSAQGLAGAPHTPISTQVFERVCAWAGLVNERKIADLEAFLIRDGKLEEFRAEVERRTNFPYQQLMARPTALLPIAAELAHLYYPKIWKNPTIFQTAHTTSLETEEERVERMLQIIEKKSGTRRVLFVLDEVGHFLQSNESLIANLDGFAKNLKLCGQGKAWMIATAQQTLPQSGPLFGLRDRFPIKVDLKASDIREITYRRLLRKCAAGRQLLSQEFADHGQQLIVLTRLDGYKTTTDLDADSFVDFYPILPSRFDVLIDSIRSLARAQGGIGLRSAIRCLQDLLTGRELKGGAVVNREIPALVTVADLYDTLEIDLESVQRDLVQHVETAKRNHGTDSWPHRVAKAAALLQQIDGFPASAQNLAALLYAEVGTPTVLTQVTEAIETLTRDESIPFGASSGGFAFLSDEVARIERERQNLIVGSTKVDACRNRLLRELFQSPPKANLAGAKIIQSGVDLFDGHRRQEIAGPNSEIRFLLRLVNPDRLDEAKNELLTESLGSDKSAFVYLAAPLAPALLAASEDLVRSEEIAAAYRNHPDREVQRYVEKQESIAETRAGEIVSLLGSSLLAGWIVFRGQPVATSTLGATLSTALNSQVESVAAQVYHRFNDAAVSVPGELAERFLQVNNLAQVAKELNPLNVISGQGTSTHVNLQHPALAAIHDFVTVPREGKRVLDHFSSAPYGWSKDTTRYLSAALFYAQQIKLVSGGEEISVIGPTAFNIFHNNTSFSRGTVKQNTSEVPPEVRQRAAQRLRDLSGEQVAPLP